MANFKRAILVWYHYTDYQSTGAYSSEIIRGGILSVSKNFIEASGALGLNKIKTFLLITLPITVRQHYQLMVMS